MEIIYLEKKTYTFNLLHCLGVAYYFIGLDLKLIVNSAILAPVAWSWIFRPICEKFNLVYIKNDIEEL